MYKNTDDIIVNEIVTAMRDNWQNPSSLYAANVKNKINECRENIAKFIGANYNEIYFTSGASESNNWAIHGYADNYANSLLRINIITTRIEHKSILSLVQSELLKDFVYYCDVDENGIVDYDCLEKMLLEHEYEPVLVSICMANNEIGTVQNVKRIASLVHQYGGILHVDATQALTHIPINVEELGVDMLSASGHKISPVLRGIGFLYKKSCINIHPLIYGAQEYEMRGGTENTYGIIGLSKAIELCDVSKKTVEKLCSKRNYFIDYLKFQFGCKLNGHSIYRLSNNINVTFPQNITSESLLYVLDMSGIKISVGSACNSSSYSPSHVLKAIGLSDEEAMRTVRFTLPSNITYKEIDTVVDEIGKAIKLIEIK